MFKAQHAIGNKFCNVLHKQHRVSPDETNDEVNVFIERRSEYLRFSN